jgi:peptidoglycan/xylan/chitin deacetylase (PgdA/CDA1 family)
MSIVLSYHKFVDQDSGYRFSRTYNQFWHDIRKKVYDLITIDDGMKCMIKACAMLDELGIRAKLFICTSLVGQPGYCTWDEIRELGKRHDIENHSHFHKDHSTVIYEIQRQSIVKAQEIITKEIGKAPAHFVAPYNRYNEDTFRIAGELRLKCLTGRENILNISK